MVPRSGRIARVMLSRVVGLLVLVFVGLGCSPAPEPYPARIRIDARFSPEQTEALIAGFDAWFDAVPQLRRSIEVTHRDPNVIAEGSPDPEHQGEYVGATTEHYHRIWLDRTKLDKRGADYRVIAMHEAGHFFGHYGHGAAGTVMAAYYSQVAFYITRADILSLCQQRGDC